MARRRHALVTATTLGMQAGNTVCGLPRYRRVVSVDAAAITCPVCGSLIAAMVVRAIRRLRGDAVETLNDPLWAYTPDGVG